MALSAQHYQQPLCTEACRREAIEGSASATGLANPPCHGLLALWRKKREEEEGRKRIGDGEEARKEGRERNCYLWLCDTGRLIQGTAF